MSTLIQPDRLRNSLPALSRRPPRLRPRRCTIRPTTGWTPATGARCSVSDAFACTTTTSSPRPGGPSSRTPVCWFCMGITITWGCTGTWSTGAWRWVLRCSPATRPAMDCPAGRAPASTNSMSTRRCFRTLRAGPSARSATWHLLGQSNGGAIALIICCIRSRSATRRTILLAPLVRPRAWLRSRISYELVRRFVQQIPRTFSENSSDPGFRVRADPGPAAAGHPAHRLAGALSRWIPRIERAATVLRLR